MTAGVLLVGERNAGCAQRIGEVPRLVDGDYTVPGAVNDFDSAETEGLLHIATQVASLDVSVPATLVCGWDEQGLPIRRFINKIRIESWPLRVR